MNPSRNLRVMAAVALAVAPFTVGFASSAMATIAFDLKSGGADTGLLVGGSCGPETCFSYIGAVGAWTVNITGGDSTGPGNPTMDLSSIDATTGVGAAPLVIEISDNGFSVGSSLFLLKSSGQVVTGSGTATYSAYFDTGNTDFAKTTLIGTLGPFSADYAANTTGAGTTGTPYSLTEHLMLTADAGGVKWSTDSSIAPVPEPASLILLGSALVGLGWWGRPRKIA